MFHLKDERVSALLLTGSFGLEKESLRITPQGRMAHTPNPFPGNEHIVWDFCENQTEINTPVLSSAQAAVDSTGGLYPADSANPGGPAPAGAAVALFQSALSSQ